MMKLHIRRNLVVRASHVEVLALSKVQLIQHQTHHRQYHMSREVFQWSQSMPVVHLNGRPPF
jgi:hypothetical protein